jgi:tyrosine-protein phosphatase OCA1
MSLFIPPSNFALVVDEVYRSSIPNTLNFPYLTQLNLRTVIFLSNKPPKRSLKLFLHSQNIKLKQFGKSPIRKLLNQSNSIVSAIGNNNGKTKGNNGNSQAPSVAGVNNSSLSTVSLAPSLSPSDGSDLPPFNPSLPYSSSSSYHSMTEDSIISALQLLLYPSHSPLLICCSSGDEYTGIIVACLRKLQRWNLASIFQEYRRFNGNQAKPMIEQFIELFDTDLIQIPSQTPQWFDSALQFYYVNSNNGQTNNRVKTPVSQLKRPDTAGREKERTEESSLSTGSAHSALVALQNSSAAPQESSSSLSLPSIPLSSPSSAILPSSII